MANRFDPGRLFRGLSRLPMFQFHFVWGPVNSLLLLLGLGLTLLILDVLGRASEGSAAAAGFSALFLLMLAHFGPRWDRLLGGLLIVAIALGMFLPSSVALTTGIAVATVLACCVQVLSHWDKAILLRLGRFQGVRGPGLCFILPFVDRFEAVVDQRLRATDFRAERILTLDTVPVYVDAICFWLVWNAEKAVLEVADYSEAVILSAQTALKDAVGRHELADLLSDRQKLGEEIQKALDEKISAWGITIQSIEITDVVIPEGLEEAMSKRAQAERERQARIILATAESEIAESFVAAAEQYRGDPGALHLRAMNMVYEGIRQQGSMVLVPSAAVESMGLGAISGLAALARGQEAAGSHDVASAGGDSDPGSAAGLDSEPGRPKEDKS